jgi:hypothetical protein
MNKNTLNEAEVYQEKFEYELREIRELIERHNSIMALDKLINEAMKNISVLSLEVTGLKEEIAELSGEKAESVKVGTKKVERAATRFLPAGAAVIDIRDDNSVFIGWNNGNVVVPYEGLSGGQKVAFDMALSCALLPEDISGGMLIVEAGELDNNNLKILLEKLAENCPENTQFIVNTCHTIKDVPDCWKVIQIS